MPNINADARFSRVPQIERPRSIFNQPCTHLTTFNVGELIPIYNQFIYPGTSIKMKMSEVIRLQTLLTPIFSNLYLDIFWFFTPMRLVWTHTKEFFGESERAWTPAVTYQVPSISAPSGGFQVGTLAHYLHYPIGIDWDNTAERRPMALPFRVYATICNEFFRDENLTDPLNIPVGDTNQTGSNGSNYITDVVNGGKPFKVAKFFDRFTGCLPSPQKASDPVTFPLISGSMAPVGTRSQNTDSYISSTFNNNAMRMSATPNNTLIEGWKQLGLSVGQGNDYGYVVEGDANLSHSSLANLVPSNLWADLSDTVGAVTVNELRLAFQLQRYYEAIARSGSRYREILKGLWGVHPADASLQIPQYLGGKRIPIQIHEVINQAQATNDYLGDLGAMSHTADYDFMWDNSFDEYGFVTCCVCARYDHVYSQGTERYLSRLDRESYYIPQFATIGEQPVFTDEICATATNMATADVFGYQEAWSDLRYKQSFVSGEFTPGIQNTLSSWHLGDYYTQAPTLSDAWIREDKTMVDRVLAVTSQVSNQILADFYFDAVYTEVLPMYSVPGLIDHY